MTTGTSAKGKQRPLNRVLLRILVLRLLLPTLALIFFIFGILGYQWQESLGQRQLQTSHSIALLVETFLGSAQRVLNSAAMVAVKVDPGTVSLVLNATRQSYSFFETIYLVDARGSIKLIAPPDPRYQGTDISRQPYYRRALAQKGVFISRPFTSLGTGHPTVFLARPLAGGGMVVGELNLDALQQAVSQSMLLSQDSTMFVADTYGTLIAHTDTKLVQEQANLGNLLIVRKGLQGDISTIYPSGNGYILGGAHPLKRLGWVVVTQQSLFSALRPLLATAGPALAVSLIVWLALLWALRTNFRKQVLTPLGRLAVTAEKISAGSLEETARVEARNEIGALAEAFNSMTDQLKRRIAVENMVAGISRRFMEMELGQAGEAFEKALGEIGRFLAVDRCYLFTYSSQRDTLSAAHQWCAGQVEGHQAELQELPAASFPWFMSCMHEAGGVAVFRLDDLGEEAAAEKALWQRHGVRSVLCVAIRRGRELRGFIGVDSLAAERLWQPEEMRFLSLAAEVFNMALDRQRAEEALRKAEEDYRGIFEHSAEGIFQSTIQGRYLKANPALARIYGFDSPQELIESTKDIGQQIYADPAQRQEFLRILKLQGQVRGFEFEVRRKDGSRAYATVDARAVRDQERKIRFLEGMVQDITGRKLAERAREELEAQLRHSQKMEAVGTLAGGIAHDFNNILTAIMGYGELAQLEAERNRNNSIQLEQIIKAAERARDLVKQLLTFSRRSETELKPIDLNQLVVQSIKMLEHTIPKMVEIKMKLSGDLKSVLADSTQLEQIIMNLASNASDAMPDGGTLVFETSPAYLDLEFCRDNPGVVPGPYVMLTVSDSGQGMGPDTLGKVFDPFFTTKEIGKGTGLGLSTVYGIVQEHGGHIVCKSELGKGTTFQIYLPVLQSEPEEAAGQDSALPLIAGGHENLLLVDDEKHIRDFTKEVLEGVGYQVVSAASGEEALEILRAGGELDLVILDLGMPGMGGHKCLRELLQINPALKVLIASGYSAEGKIQDMLQQGAVGYIAKPFKRNDLLLKVRSTLDQ
jgi:PAS domain S-box-containing protein